jgi:hypothetical protein
MPGINLEALNTGDLRRLLKVAQERHDGPLADELERQIAARATSAARMVSPFATLPDEEPDMLRFRMEATNDAPTDPELSEKPPAPAPDRGRLLTLGLGALAGCLATGVVIWGAEWMGAEAQRPLPGQDVALASLTPVPSLPGLSEAVLIAGASAPSLAPLEQAFSAPQLSAPPAVRVASKKTPRKRLARVSEPDPETVEAAADPEQRARGSPSLAEWLRRQDENEPIY